MTTIVWPNKRPRPVNWQNWIMLILVAVFMAAAADECGNEQQSCTRSCPNSGACNRCDSKHW